MPYQLKSVTKPSDVPEIVIYADFREFRDKAPRESKYLNHKGDIVQKKRINNDNFMDVAEKIDASVVPTTQVSSAPPNNSSSAEPNTSGAAAPTKPTNQKTATDTTKPEIAQPAPNLESFGKTLSEAISNSLQGSTNKAAEAWTAALKSALEASNSNLKEALETLSTAYLELGSKVTEALNSGVLDQVADRRFQAIQKTLEDLNEKTLAEILEEKASIEQIRSEIDKKLGNLGHLAADIQEDSEAVMRRVDKFKLGTAEMLQQQVDQLQKQLDEARGDNAKLSKELQEIRCSLGEANPEYVHDLEKRVASLTTMKSEILDKDLQIQQLEAERNSLRALSETKLKDFKDHQRLEELEELSKGYERDKEEWQRQLEETKQDLAGTQKRLKEAREKARILTETARSMEDLEMSLREAAKLADTRRDELEEIQHTKEFIENELAELKLALAQGEQHYRETLLDADRTALQNEFRTRELRFEAELGQLIGELDRQIQYSERLEQQKLKIEEEAEVVAAKMRDLQRHIDTDLPQAYEQAKAEIRKLRADDERLASLITSCAHHEQHEKELRDKIANLRIDEAELQKEVAGLRRIVGELTAEQEKLAALKKKIDLAHNEIKADLVADPIAGTFQIKDEQTEESWLKGIRKGIRDEGFEISDRLLHAFHTALKCQDISPLTLLMGISGTGKSELPRLYSAFGGIHFHLASVQPNWDSPSDLFGFYNYAEGRPKLEPLSRHLLQFLPTIGKDGDSRPKRGDELLLVLLDEMNLARVEYYFSDLLSRLEARRSLLGKLVDKDSHLRASISLDMGASESRHLFLDSNVMFVGTLNQDESTLEVSDKVLDRSNAITFPRPKSFCPVTKTTAATDKSADWRLSRQTWDEWCKGKGQTLIDTGELQAKFQKINGALKHVDRGVAHRVFQAVQRYVESYPAFTAGSAEKAAEMALVDQFAMKILPKLKGVPTDTQNGKACLGGIESVLPEDLKEDFAHARRDDFFEWQGCEKLFEIHS